MGGWGKMGVGIAATTGCASGCLVKLNELQPAANTIEQLNIAREKYVINSLALYSGRRYLIPCYGWLESMKM
jgi:hypothetical protein